MKAKKGFMNITRTKCIQNLFHMLFFVWASGYFQNCSCSCRCCKKRVRWLVVNKLTSDSFTMFTMNQKKTVQTSGLKTNTSFVILLPELYRKQIWLSIFNEFMIDKQTGNTQKWTRSRLWYWYRMCILHFLYKNLCKFR